MASIRRNPSFTNEQLSVLQQAFDLACADLRLSPDRQPLREHLGALIFEIAATGEANGAALRRRAVRRFQHCVAARPVKIASASVVAFVGRLNGGINHRSGDR